MHFTILLALVLASNGDMRANDNAIDQVGNRLPKVASVRLGSVRFRHELPIATVQYAPDGKTLASIGYDHTIRFWDTAGGNRSVIRLSESDPLPRLAFSPVGKMFALGMSVWNEKSKSYEMHVQLRELGQERIVQKYSLPAREFNSAAAPPVAFSPDGKTVAMGGDGVVFLWDFAGGKLARKAAVQRTRVCDVVFTADGKTLAAGGEDGEVASGTASMIHLVDVATSKELHALEIPGPWVANQCLTISADSKTLAAPWVEDGFAGLFKGMKTAFWDIGSGKRIRLQNERSLLRGLMFAPKGSNFLAVDNRALRLRDSADGKDMLTVEHSGTTLCAAFAPDGKTLAYGDGHAIRLYDLEARKEIPMPPAHTGAVSAVVFLPDGKSVVSAGDHSARTWDVVTSREIHRLISAHAGHQQAILPIAELGMDNVPLRSTMLSHDARVLVAGAARDETVRLFDVESGKEREVMKGATDKYQAMMREFTMWIHLGPAALTHDGKTVAWAHLTVVPKNTTLKVVVWDVEKRRSRFDALSLGDVGYVAALDFSPDGKKLVASYVSGLRGEGRVRLWNARTGAEEWTWKDEQQNDDHDRKVHSQAFSRDGKTIHVGTGHGIIRSLDLATGKQIRQFQAHEHAVTALAFSADGNWLASGDNRGGLHLWNMKTGKQTLRLESLAGISCLIFSEDGTKLASGLWDTTTLLWDLQGQLKNSKE